jgi:hypothetical protein
VSTQLIAWPGEVISFNYKNGLASGSGDVAGVYVMDVLNPPNFPAPTGKGLDLSDHFNAVCVDLLHVIYPNTRYDWTIVDLKDVPDTGPMGQTRANDLAELFNRHNPNDSSMTNAQKAAMGVLAWEIVLESVWTGGAKPWGLGTGDLRITGLSTAAQGYFNTWAGELTGAGPTGQVYAIVNPGTQDFGILIPGVGNDQHPVPEPLTLLAFGSAVAGLAGYIRRRRAA